MYGETRPRIHDLASRRVRAASSQPATGLSPHVRGNPQAHLAVVHGAGSIPACTGKPSTSASYRSGDGVYPRMYGETPDATIERLHPDGLSPHVRGNPL